ncbi:MAG: RHS repeat-associated core domain-containing protein [Ekhidna sp.]|uniref:RHS repeat protein n=1 Tax=Ekhidna sp. TaxID=2608089 RepID=UPI0032EEAFB0
MNYITAGFQQISTSAQGVGVHEEVLLEDIVADRAGYLLAYLSNENSEAVNVHFDDFEVRHAKTNVVQVIDYYPFGLEAMTYTRTAADPTKYLYNGGVEKNPHSGFYETFYRLYDPAIGRFTAIDPLASSFTSLTPYQYAYNDPVYWNDPNGDCPECDVWWENFFRVVDSFLHDDGIGNGGMTYMDGSWGAAYGAEIAFWTGHDYNEQHNSWGIFGGPGSATEAANAYYVYQNMNSYVMVNSSTMMPVLDANGNDTYSGFTALDQVTVSGRNMSLDTGNDAWSGFTSSMENMFGWQRDQMRDDLGPLPLPQGVDRQIGGVIQHNSSVGYAGSRGYFNTVADYVEGIEDFTIMYPTGSNSNLYDRAQYFMGFFERYVDLIQDGLTPSNDSIKYHDWGREIRLGPDSTLMDMIYPRGYKVVTPNGSFHLPSSKWPD